MAKDKYDKKMDKIEEIEGEMDSVNHKKEFLLRQLGWENECDFPDSCWRWCKKIGDRTVCTTRDDAIQLEKQIT